MNRAVGLLAVAWTIGFAASAGEWQVIQTGPILVKERERPGSSAKEMWAEGILDAGVPDIQDAVTDVSRFTRFMPCVTEAKQLGPEAADGGATLYQRLDFPFFLSPRDLVHETHLDRDARTDPEGIFENHWFAVPDAVPEKKGLIRLRTSEGSWQVRPEALGKSHVLYRFAVDPGGMIPSFAANFGSTKGIRDTFQAVEAEAQRRAGERARPVQ